MFQEISKHYHAPGSALDEKCHACREHVGATSEYNKFPFVLQHKASKIAEVILFRNDDKATWKLAEVLEYAAHRAYTSHMPHAVVVFDQHDGERDFAIITHFQLSAWHNAEAGMFWERLENFVGFVPYENADLVAEFGTPAWEILFKDKTSGAGES